MPVTFALATMAGKATVAVVGGGISGLAAAWHLAQAGGKKREKRELKLVREREREKARDCEGDAKVVRGE